ncbi:AP2 domain family protein [Babesia bovis T2Bo]|uniref:AP2/ERF domain-containing protein n=1 Tax=Babesia bovis TaxID=5865 RepID=A7ASK2_BABBO|nr:AP2 domain family protein [Babesia bovis T2Bo]EDO07521.1 AP2 domain family protein [Babesia bovis T2Bo]|eukprot:XP_001611089.1 hypothetical protein [Babesia bovis T2Bo]
MPEMCGLVECPLTVRMLRRLPVLNGISYDDRRRRWCVRVPSEICDFGQPLYFSATESDASTAWLSAAYHWCRLILSHVRNDVDQCSCGVCQIPTDDPADGVRLSAYDFSESSADGIYASAIVPYGGCNSSSVWSSSDGDNILSNCNCMSYSFPGVLPDGVNSPDAMISSSEISGMILNSDLDLHSNIDYHLSSVDSCFGNITVSESAKTVANENIGTGNLKDKMVNRRFGCIKPTPGICREKKRNAFGKHVAHSSTIRECDHDENGRTGVSNNTYASKRRYPKPTSDKSRAYSSLVHALSYDNDNVIQGNQREHCTDCSEAPSFFADTSASSMVGDDNRFTYVVQGHVNYDNLHSSYSNNLESDDMELFMSFDRMNSNNDTGKERKGDSKSCITSFTSINHGEGCKSDFGGSNIDSSVTSDPPLSYKTDEPRFTEHDVGDYNGGVLLCDAPVSSPSVSLHSGGFELQPSSSTSGGIKYPNTDSIIKTDYNMRDDNNGEIRSLKSRRTSKIHRSTTPHSSNDIADSLRPWYREVFWVPSISRWRTSYNDEFGLRHTKTFTPSFFGGVKAAYDAAVEYKTAVERICRATGISDEERVTLRRNADMSLKRKRLPRCSNSDSESSPSTSNTGNRPALLSTTRLLKSVDEPITVEPKLSAPPTNDGPSTSNQFDKLSKQIPSSIYTNAE